MNGLSKSLLDRGCVVGGTSLSVREKPSEDWERLLAAKALGSYRRLGDAARISHETARRVVTGRAADVHSIEAVAAALGVDVEEVYTLRGEAPPPVSMWEPPPAARLLTADEREVLSRLIGVITTGRDEGSGGDAGSAAAKTVPPVTVDEGEVIVPGESRTRGSGGRGRSPSPRRQGRV